MYFNENTNYNKKYLIYPSVRQLSLQTNINHLSTPSSNSKKAGRNLSYAGHLIKTVTKTLIIHQKVVSMVFRKNLLHENLQ